MYCFRFLNTCMRKDFKESLATFLVQFIASVVKLQSIIIAYETRCFILISLHYWYTKNSRVFMRCLSILFIIFISSPIWFGDMARVKSNFLKTFPTATLYFRQTHILNAQRTAI